MKSVLLAALFAVLLTAQTKPPAPAAPTEDDNLRQALNFFVEEAEEREAGEKGLRMGAALQYFWWTRGHLSEGRERLRALLEHPKGREPTRARADADMPPCSPHRLPGTHAGAGRWALRGYLRSHNDGNPRGRGQMRLMERARWPACKGTMVTRGFCMRRAWQYGASWSTR